MSRIMVISEKPTAARKIAVALDEKGSPSEVKKRGASYFECRHGSDTVVVVYALGHLFELKQTEKGWTYPRLDTEWVPKYEIEKKAVNVKPIIGLIKALAKDMDAFVIATDYDIEGSLIGYLTLKYACRADPKAAQRMFFSTLTTKELQDSYDNASKSLDFPMIYAGHVRHEVDWLYGINLTRALTLAIKKASDWFKIVSTGRVQGPILAMVAERDRKINVYVPSPYWDIETLGDYKGTEMALEYSKGRVEIFRDAEGIANALEGSAGKVEDIKRSQVSQPPPVPFNLSGLQAEAYRHFGYKPSKTLALAQSLYLEGVISYPRTGSQMIPPTIDIKQILTKLKERAQFKAHAGKILSGKSLVPMQGKATDPAHPAIHPTGEKPTKRLTPSENKVYDLIVRRFLAIFGSSAKKERLRIDISCEEHLLYSRGQRILDYGWMEYYDKYATLNEKILPDMKEGQAVAIKRSEAVEKRTTPPRRYNPASLLKLLEKEELGTKATRASIVDSVRSRGYTLNDSFEMSTLGYALYETLQTYVPSLLSPEFTRELQKEMDRILEGETDREAILEEAKKDLLQLLNSFKAKEEMIGRDLVNGLQRFWKESEEVGPCPKCGDGKLMIIRSAKTGKRFVGCSNYRENRCDQTFPLPQKGRIASLDKKCQHCGYQMIRVGAGRTGFETCINWTKCPGRQDALKTLEERRAKGGKKDD
ncbi:MAG: DNA topoisomerase I [Candidatus Thorarchaeota archaeon]